MYFFMKTDLFISSPINSKIQKYVSQENVDEGQTFSPMSPNSCDWPCKKRVIFVFVKSPTIYRCTFARGIPHFDENHFAKNQWSKILKSITSSKISKQTDHFFENCMKSYCQKY